MTRVVHRLGQRILLGALVLSSGACDVVSDVLPEASPTAPDTPTVLAPSSPFAGDVAVLRGTRPANTALLVDDIEVIARGREGAFSLPLPVAVGPNTFEFVAVDAVGRRSAPRVVTIVRDGDAPGPIVVSPLPARTALAEIVDVTLQKPADCSVLKDGRTLDVNLTSTTTTVDLQLVDGPQTIRFACVDVAGNESVVTAVDIERRDVDSELFALQAVPAQVTTAQLALRATCDDNDVEARINAQPAKRCTNRVWTDTVTLVPGPQTITVRAAFVGELEAVALELPLDVTLVAAAEGEGEGEGEEP